MIKQKQALLSGILLVAIAIMLGALGAHGLKGKISASSLESFKTGVLYHLLMSCMLVSINYGHSKNPPKYFNTLLLIGIVLFSGSIYALSTESLWLQEGSLRFLGPVTPLGGLSFIFAWILFFIQQLKAKM